MCCRNYVWVHKVLRPVVVDFVVQQPWAVGKQLVQHEMREPAIQVNSPP